MAKITLTDLTSLANDTSATNSINQNFQAIEDYINNQSFSRDPSGEVNTLADSLDMNNNNIANCNTLSTDKLIIDGVGVVTQFYEPDVARLTEANDYSATQRANTYVADITGAVTLDMGIYNNFVLTLTGNVTLNNPNNALLGQSGFIAVRQDATGARTFNMGNQFYTKTGNAPILGVEPNEITLFGYVVIGSEILLGDPITGYTSV